MSVSLLQVPSNAFAISINKLGQLKGIRKGRPTWKCDYMLLWESDTEDGAIFIELKKRFSNFPRAGEQLRRSPAYLDYLCAVCRIEHKLRATPRPSNISYVLIARDGLPSLSRLELYGSQLQKPLFYEDIVVYPLIGETHKFARLRRNDRSAAVRPKP